MHGGSYLEPLSDAKAWSPQGPAADGAVERDGACQACECEAVSFSALVRAAQRLGRQCQVGARR